ncbi:hypothetical protein [Polaromonas jejuensis]|uniref:Cysteine hydrolase n=1 Tax=Polaromonas jejuensis TaxID=457502 RepID=A0ABW0Q905_9BURK|nr:hypothetical protein [Polaromonas jejuensis]
MNHGLLVIDPQNDFCDQPGASLPVAGACADMGRLADFMTRMGSRLSRLIVTLDSHPYVGIERPTFWQTGTRDAIAPFTPILAADVEAGRFLPRRAELRPQVLNYLRALEAAGRYTLMVWPVHCVTGTWGHNIEQQVAAALNQWELTHQRQVTKVLKGMNPMTEQYSAIRAEVPCPDDPLTLPNQTLLASLKAIDGYLYVAGEASSHCVKATMEDVFQALTPQQMGRIILLTDCMSPVAGFEQQSEAFMSFARGLGAKTLTSAQAMAQHG